MKLNLLSFENLNTPLPDQTVLVDKKPIITTAIIIDMVTSTLEKVALDTPITNIIKERIANQVISVLNSEDT